MAYLAKNPSVSFKSAPAHIQTLYSWVRLNDPAELPSFAPESRYRPVGRQGISAQDEAVAKAIHALLADAMITLTRRGARRVSVSGILRHFAPIISIPHHALPEMPRTAAVIESMVETRDAYHARRMGQFVEEIEQTLNLPTWYRIYHKFDCARMSADDHARIRAAYSNRSQINRNGPIAKAA
jgi:hypothetical protein